LGNLLPSVSYFTEMDYFITASTVLVFMALVIAILTSRLTMNDRPELASKIEFACRILFPTSFAGVTAYTFLF